jgi:thiosulfate/3-mercaptopyruvate sulfurtransferase
MLPARVRALLLLPALLALAGCAPAGAPAAAQPQGSGLFVSADWLWTFLPNPRLVLFHADVDRQAYDRAHIPAARFIAVSDIAEDDGRGPELLPPDRLRAVLEAAGVGDASRVVVYGHPLAAAYTLVALDRVGLGANGSLLDGGLVAWTRAGRPVVTAPTAVTRRTITSPPRDFIVDAAWVAEHKDRPGGRLLDARPAAQFTGQVAGDAVARPGHIPGARNLPWDRTIRSPDEPFLRDRAELEALFRDAGVRPGDLVVTYCRSGMQSSFLYLVARHLGYDARLYDGSFVDWSARAELPVATGPGG